MPSLPTTPPDPISFLGHGVEGLVLYTLGGALFIIFCLISILLLVLSNAMKHNDRFTAKIEESTKEMHKVRMETEKNTGATARLADIIESSVRQRNR